MRRAFFAALFTLCACSGSSTDANNDGIADGPYNPNDVSVIAPSQPKGNISGLVLDAAGAPIAGASVAIAIGTTAAATTDSSGHFSFTGLPAGSSAGLTITKAGYTTAHAQTVIPDAAGNVPINDATAFVGPVRLFATSHTVTVNVVGYDGQPLAPSAVLQVSPAYMVETSSGFINGGWTVVSATGTDGVIKFAGVPDLADLARLTSTQALLSLAIDPIDVDGDGLYEYGGATVVHTAADVLASPGLLNIVLPPPNQGSGSLQIAASSCGTLVTTGAGGGGAAGSLVNAGDKVFVAFNQPVATGSVAVQVLDDTGTPIDVTTNLAASGTVADFSGNFPPGHALSVTVSATASASRPASRVTFGGTCFVAPTGSAPAVVAARYQSDDGGALQPGETVYVELDSAIGSDRGGFSAPVLSAYIDADFDGDAQRNSVGEFPIAPATNSSSGFLTFADNRKPIEANGTFARFFTFTYAPGGIALPVSPSRAVHIYFDDSRTAGFGPESWVNGTPLQPGSQIAGFLTPVPTP